MRTHILGLLLLVPSMACSNSGNSGGDAGGDAGSSDGQDGNDMPAPDAANVPDCTIQHPTLLSGYVVRPPWSVAGVDYCVGYPSSTVLKDPATISMAGVTINATTKIATVTGNDVTLDGYDFSLGGGWGIDVKAANTRVVNSKFLVGANGHQPFHGLDNAANLYVGYSVIDGNAQDTFSGGLIMTTGDGLTVEYCWLKNAGGDIIQAHRKGHLVLRNNLMEHVGLLPGAHGDYTQLLGGPFVATFLNNTAVQDGGSTQGFMAEPDVGASVGVITSGDIGNNTLVGLDGPSYWVGVTVPDIVETFTVHDNYFDVSGAYGFAVGGIRGGPGDSSPKTTYTNNHNMLSGDLLEQP